MRPETMAVTYTRSVETTNRIIGSVLISIRAKDAALKASALHFQTRAASTVHTRKPFSDRSSRLAADRYRTSAKGRVPVLLKAD